MYILSVGSEVRPSTSPQCFFRIHGQKEILQHTVDDSPSVIVRMKSGALDRPHPAKIRYEYLPDPCTATIFSDFQRNPRSAFEQIGTIGPEPAAVQQLGPHFTPSGNHVAVQRTPVPGQEPSLVTTYGAICYMP